MASRGVTPEAATPSVALSALESDLPRVLKGRTLEEAGWLRPEPLTLIMPVEGVRNGIREPYTLRLRFGYYPEWPPSAQFVNPGTGAYRHPEDLCWLPKVEGFEELHVHPHYRVVGQLICCSATLEFYQVGHDVKDQHLWDYRRHNFASTINAIEGALRSSYYKGPFAERTA